MFPDGLIFVRVQVVGINGLQHAPNHDADESLEESQIFPEGEYIIRIYDRVHEVSYSPVNSWYRV